jgi:DNA-directed RNA polymerase I subunit RPA1
MKLTGSMTFLWFVLYFDLTVDLTIDLLFPPPPPLPQSVVWETPSIKKGFLSESSEPGEAGLWRLKTDGVNLQEMWRHEDVLDLNRVYTNNIHAMAEVYGIEAAYKAIIKVHKNCVYLRPDILK